MDTLPFRVAGALLLLGVAACSAPSADVPPAAHDHTPAAHDPGASPAPPAPPSGADHGTLCAPELRDPWVRVAPPGVAMLAGYATLRNPCAAPIVVVGAESLDFASASVHTTSEEDGMSRMRAAGPVTVGAKAQVEFAPGGMHLMLMGPERPFAEGDRARIRLVLADGRRVFAEFAVRREAPR